jgi:hypothetical protein
LRTWSDKILSSFFEIDICHYINHHKHSYFRSLKAKKLTMLLKQSRTREKGN